MAQNGEVYILGSDMITRRFVTDNDSVHTLTMWIPLDKRQLLMCRDVFSSSLLIQSLYSVMESRIFSRGLQHTDRKSKTSFGSDAWDQQLQDVLIPFLKEVLRSYHMYGFALVTFRPHEHLFFVPCIVDPCKIEVEMRTSPSGVIQYRINAGFQFYTETAYRSPLPMPIFHFTYTCPSANGSVNSIARILAPYELFMRKMRTMQEVRAVSGLHPELAITPQKPAPFRDGVGATPPFQPPDSKLVSDLINGTPSGPTCAEVCTATDATASLISRIAADCIRARERLESAVSTTSVRQRRDAGGGGGDDPGNHPVHHREGGGPDPNAALPPARARDRHVSGDSVHPVIYQDIGIDLKIYEQHLMELVGMMLGAPVMLGMHGSVSLHGVRTKNLSNDDSAMRIFLERAALWQRPLCSIVELYYNGLFLLSRAFESMLLEMRKKKPPLPSGVLFSLDQTNAPHKYNAKYEDDVYNAFHIDDVDKLPTQFSLGGTINFNGIMQLAAADAIDPDTFIDLFCHEHNIPRRYAHAPKVPLSLAFAAETALVRAQVTGTQLQAKAAMIRSEAARTTANKPTPKPTGSGAAKKRKTP